jgi:hypothetical protein
MNPKPMILWVRSMRNVWPKTQDYGDTNTSLSRWRLLVCWEVGASYVA